MQQQHAFSQTDVEPMTAEGIWFMRIVFGLLGIFVGIPIFLAFLPLILMSIVPMALIVGVVLAISVAASVLASKFPPKP